MTTVLTVPPWLAGMTMAAPIWGKLVCRRYAVTGDRQHVAVPTQVSATTTAVPDGARLLDDTIRATPGGVIVMGASLGSVIASRWIDTFGRGADRPDPARVRFVLLANPARGAKRGGLNISTFNAAPLSPAPTDTGYRVDDVARRGDKYAAPCGMRNAAAIHSNYFGVDLDHLDRDAVSVQPAGGTTYWLLP